jgi:hypothetical protein
MAKSGWECSDLSTRNKPLKCVNLVVINLDVDKNMALKTNKDLKIDIISPCDDTVIDEIMSIEDDAKRDEIRLEIKNVIMSLFWYRHVAHGVPHFSL